MPNKSDSCGPYIVFAPLPKLTVEGEITPDAMAPLVKDGLIFTRMDPALRRSLLEAAKSADASDDVLSLILESELVFWASVPRPLPSELEIYSIRDQAKLFSQVAQNIFERVYNCIMIFSLLTFRLGRCCWFSARGVLGQNDLRDVSVIKPQWINDPPPSYIELPPTRETHPMLGKLMLEVFALLWERLAPLLLIDNLKSVLTNPDKCRGYLDAAEDYAKREAQKFKTVRTNETGTSPESEPEGAAYDRWWGKGYMRAFHRELEKLDLNQQEVSKGARFIRAMQFFSNAPILPFPHRFLALITCLESLFSKEPGEVTFQIAARTAWFLAPEDASKRAELFDDVKSLYALCSDIVHGRTFNILADDDRIVKAEGLVRCVLMGLVCDDSILQLILAKDRKPYEDYLSGLSLGRTRTDKSGRKG